MDSKIDVADGQSAELKSSRKGQPDFLDTALYYRLFREAEIVRWKASDIPWSRIEPDKVSTALVGLVRETTFAELTTWSATRLFLQSFEKDVDFTQWIAIWLYEETKHPQVLMQWLKRLGETFSLEFMLEGRKTHPFMNSQLGTLVLNILSEIEASTYYMNLSQNVREPVLRLIARNLGADEARHASSFYSYAKRWLETSDNPDADRLEILKVLYFWLVNNKSVKHPFSLFANRVAGQADGEEMRRILAFKSEAMYRRMRSLIGTLVGLPLESKGDVKREFSDLQAQLYAL